MKRLVAFIAISLLSIIANAGGLALQDCKEAVANSKKEVKFPSTVDETTKFTDMKCGIELYKGKPTYEFYYKTSQATSYQLNPDFQKIMKSAIFDDTCIKRFNSISEIANRKYIYSNSKGEVTTEVLISSDECMNTPTAHLAIKISAELEEIREREKVRGLLGMWDEADYIRQKEKVFELQKQLQQLQKQKEGFASEAIQTGLIVADAIKDETKRQSALVKKDDATCKSYGGKKGTQAYIQCRVSLVASRQEAADRQQTMDALEKKIETLQSQIKSQALAQSEAQERDRMLSAEQYASEQEFKNKQIELQQAQLRTLQQEAQSAREARKWQNIQRSLDAMGAVTPVTPSPFSSYRIDGRTYRCTDIGGQVNCR